MQQSLVVRIRRPPFYWQRICYVHMGQRVMHSQTRGQKPTFVPAVADGRVVHETHPTQILFHQSQVFDVASIGLHMAVFSVQLFGKQIAAAIEPIDYRVRIFRHGCGKDHKCVPRGDLTRLCLSVFVKINKRGKKATYLFKEMIYVRTFIDMIHCTPPIHHHLDGVALLGSSIAKHAADTKTQQPTTARAAARIMNGPARRVYQRLV